MSFFIEPVTLMNRIRKIYYSREGVISLILLITLFIYSKILCPQASSVFWPFTELDNDGSNCYSYYQIENDIMGFGYFELVIYALIMPWLLHNFTIPFKLIMSAMGIRESTELNPKNAFTLDGLNKTWIFFHIVIWQVSRNISTDADRGLWPFGPTFSKRHGNISWLPAGSSEMRNRLAGYDWKDFAFYIIVFLIFRGLFKYNYPRKDGASIKKNTGF